MFFILFIMSSIMVLLPLALAKRYGTISMISPLHIVGYLSFFGIFSKTLYLHAFNGEMYFQRFVSSTTPVIDGYLFIFGFILMICLGYVFAVKRIWKVEPGFTGLEVISQIKHPRLLVVLAVFISLIVIAQMISARGLGGISSVLKLSTIDAVSSKKVLRIEGTTGFGATNAAIRLFLFVPQLALAVYITRYFLFRRDLMIMLGLFSLELFLVVLQGKRFHLINIVALFVIISALLGREFNFKIFFKGILGAIFMAIFFVIMTSFRSNKDDAGAIIFDVTNAIKHIFGATYFLDVNIPIIIISKAKEIPYFFGETYFFWTFAWIPRAVWANKPAVSLGSFIKSDLLGITGTLGGYNATGPGEAFLNFGWMGILVGFFLGFSYRKLEVFTLSPKGMKRHYGFWIYPIIIFPLIIGTLQSSFSASLTPAIVTWVILIFLLGFLADRKQ